MVWVVPGKGGRSCGTAERSSVLSSALNLFWTEVYLFPDGKTATVGCYSSIEPERHRRRSAAALESLGERASV